MSDNVQLVFVKKLEDTFTLLISVVQQFEEFSCRGILMQIYMWYSLG